MCLHRASRAVSDPTPRDLIRGVETPSLPFHFGLRQNGYSLTEVYPLRLACIPCTLVGGLNSVRREPSEI